MYVGQFAMHMRKINHEKGYWSNLDVQSPLWIPSKQTQTHHRVPYTFCQFVTTIHLSCILLQCIWTIAPERGWGGHFHPFAVFLSTMTSIWHHCLLKCGKSLLIFTSKVLDITLRHCVLHSHPSQSWSSQYGHPTNYSMHKLFVVWHWIHFIYEAKWNLGKVKI